MRIHILHLFKLSLSNYQCLTVLLQISDDVYGELSGSEASLSQKEQAELNPEKEQREIYLNEQCETASLLKEEGDFLVLLDSQCHFSHAVVENSNVFEGCLQFR